MAAIMIRTLAILCLAAAPAIGIWQKGFRIRFDVNILEAGKTAYFNMPQNSTVAADAGYVQVEKPTLPTGYSALTLWCLETEYTVCLWYDDTGYIAGLQIAFLAENLTSLYDPAVTGFTNWTISINGTSSTFRVVQQLYVSTDFLATDPATRIAARDDDYLLQDSDIYLSGFNGDLYNVSTTVANFADDSVYTKQGCMIMMGRHYYYNMTSALECLATTIFPWFPLAYNNQLVGVGFLHPGTYTLSSSWTNWFEAPSKTAIKLIVPNGPDCLYNMADDPGVITMHTYFILKPYQITCIW